MFRHLGSSRLTTGEELILGVVEAPDPAWATQLLPFLGHKPTHFRRHLEHALEAPLDNLETRFYVGLLGGHVITQVMIVGARGVGILGHVFTLPEHRRKGAYRAIMTAQMRDCVDVGFRIITLGTGFDSAPYHIYASYGFRSIVPGSGDMMWMASEDEESRFWTHHRARVRPARWDDWAHLSLLTARPADSDEERPRSFYFNVLDLGFLEGPYVALRSAMLRDSSLKAWVLEAVADDGRPGAIAGIVVLAPEARSFGSLKQLDMTVHPGWKDQATELIRPALEPGPHIVAYASQPNGTRAIAYTASGFDAVATLPSWLPDGHAPWDVTVYRRE